MLRGDKMELRKVVRFGKSSFVVSLPKAWVERNKLKKGEMLAVNEKPDEIVFSLRNANNKSSDFRKITINGKKGIDELKTEITSAYINNYNMIRIENLEEKTLPKVKEIIHGLVGIEIIEETATVIVAKDLLDISEVSIDTIIRRMDLLTRTMIDDSLQIEEDRYESIYGRDNEVNRLSLLGFRVARAVINNPALLKMFNTTNWDIVLSRQIIIQLERFADQTKRIARLLRRIRDKNEKKTFQKHYALLKEKYLQVMKTYYSKNKEEAYKLESTTKNLLRTSDKLCEKYKDTEIIRLSEFLKHMITALISITRSVMEKEI